MSTGTSCHFGHLLQASKKSLWSLILYMFFFHDFIHVYSSRAGADSPQGIKFWCQQKCLVTSFICYKFKKKCLWSLIVYNFLHDLIHVYSPGAGTESPQGTKFDVNRKALPLYPFVASFKEISLKSDFIHFFHDLIHVYSTGAGTYSPLVDKVLMWTETSCHFGHLLPVSNHRRR